MLRGKEAQQHRIHALVAAAALVFAAIALLFPISARAAEKGVVPDLTWGTSSGDQDRTAAAISDVGAKWVRLSANWADAEPSKGQYNTWWLSQYDRAVQLAHNAGAHIVMMSYQSPQWASGSTTKETPPKDPADYAHFMGFLASRYAGKVDAYEVWNEENLNRFWSTGASPSAYVSLLKPAYAAIKSADPNAKVVFGGLSTNDYRFVEGAYAAGAKGNFDVMGLHPYTCATSPDSVWRDGNNRVANASFTGYREVRASMLANSDDKPIWFTEFGWSTTSQSCGVSEATQADYLTKALHLADQDSYVQVALWYNFRNNYWSNNADSLEDRYGLLRSDFSQKPAYQAFKSYVPGSATTSPTSGTTSPRKKTRTKLTLTSGVSAASTKRSKSRSHGGKRMISGKVIGATTGRVTLHLQRYNRAKHKWSKAKVRRTTLTSAGTFSKRLGHMKHGRWRVRGTYEGAPGFAASSSRQIHFKL